MASYPSRSPSQSLLTWDKIYLWLFCLDKIMDVWGWNLICKNLKLSEKIFCLLLRIPFRFQLSILLWERESNSLTQTKTWYIVMPLMIILKPPLFEKVWCIKKASTWVFEISYKSLFVGIILYERWMYSTLLIIRNAVIFITKANETWRKRLWITRRSCVLTFVSFLVWSTWRLIIIYMEMCFWL